MSVQIRDATRPLGTRATKRETARGMRANFYARTSPRARRGGLREDLQDRKTTRSRLVARVYVSRDKV